MENVLRFIVDKFDFNVLVLFFLSSIFLIFIDGREYKEKGYNKEYKFSKNSGIFFAIFGLVMFITAKIIKI